MKTTETFLSDIEKQWGWHLAAAAVLLVLGLVAFGHAIVDPLHTFELVGWILLAGACIEGVQAWRARKDRTGTSHIVSGGLMLVLGLFSIIAPHFAGIGLTVPFAIYLILAGLARAVGAVWFRIRGWMWIGAGGLLSFALGLALWKAWPVKDPGFAGICVGLDLAMTGASWGALALAARQGRTEPARP